eukprot:CAMPEP_0115014392 /NCGR_PEP_ID=MMETSP0216-20121206/26047_1 /TAXON_ID=223996 /ORGANISM="Protocruzia adherens, Strain Boccale" /LENGTH=576 /DNA_ID=CAMNT_0002384115 /DNA_START=26 /DNA_END=1756 /DNA_ORIENTATION=-
MNNEEEKKLGKNDEDHEDDPDVDNDDDDDEDDDDEDDEDDVDDEDEEEKEEDLNPQLIEASKEGDVEKLKFLLGKRTDPTCEDENKWNPLIWAAVNGHEEVVRVLLKNGAGSTYLSESEARRKEEMETAGTFKKPKNPAEIGKYTPMHWAAYKNNFRVIWILIKEGFSPYDIDIYGNTAIHQAAASNSLEVIETFMGQGYDMAGKNARGHTPFDLASDEMVKSRIRSSVKTEYCAGSGSPFQYQEPRNWCRISNNFYGDAYCTKSWVYETIESEERDRPVTRSIEAGNNIKKAEDRLVQAMDSALFLEVDEALKHVTKYEIDIDVKLKHEAEVLHEKLKRQDDIKDLVKKLQVVDDYRTIQKSVNVLKEKKQDAIRNQVHLDDDMISLVEKEAKRLIAERNLRYQTLISPVSTATDDHVKKLEATLNEAMQYGVSEDYVKTAEDLSGRMQGNINAHHTLALLIDYPTREYPEPEQIDPRTKKPVSKDPPPKKKKKKEPPFPIPEWALEIGATQQKVNELQAFVNQAEELELTEDFLQQGKEQMDRFKKEIKFRKMELEEKKLAEEKRQAAKKKKKP